MQDAERLREQVEEMTLRAEIRAQVAEDHKTFVVERRQMAEREIHKLRLLNEVFTIGDHVLRERKTKLLAVEGSKPDDTAVGALNDAIANVETLSQQATRAITHNEGALAALQAVEQTLAQKAIEATARARGLVVQGSKAVAVAERQTEPPSSPKSPQTTQKTPVMASSEKISGVSGFLDTDTDS